ncbi:MAG: hypothetical protein HC934_00535 [Acaryochloridaceae cyanobacterium SU_2_1]|nr:hypothetical protein [Acaryochloridaceae cyanobacterium SU_2_1]
MEDRDLIQRYIVSYLAGQSLLLSNTDLKVEPISDTLQLLAKHEGLVATAKLTGEHRHTAVRYKSSFWPQLHEAMVDQQCLPTRPATISGFYDYEPIEIPANYQVQFTDSLDLLQTWWSFKTPEKQQSLMKLLVLHRGTWYPIRDLDSSQGTLTIQTLGHQIKLYPLDMLVWLKKEELPTAHNGIDQENRQGYSRRRSDRIKQHLSIHRRAMAAHYPDAKKIGSYLIEAGLLSSAQLELVLADQKLTGMRFGEILVSRGWLKAQTIEFLMANIILPQRTLAKRQAESTQKQLVDQLKEVNAVQQARQGLTEASPSMPPESMPATPQNVSIHDRETLLTYDKSGLDELPDWKDCKE